MSTITNTVAPTSRVPWRTMGLVAILILAIAVGAAILIGSRSPTLPAPFGLAANGVILTVAGENIVARKTLDGEPRTIVDLDRPVLGIEPMPDGTRFSFYVANPDESLDVWVADMDGSHQQRIGGPFHAPDWTAWSPQGDVLAVSETPESGNTHLALVPVEGGATTVLDLGIPSAEPMWRAPDGRQLLFRSPNASDTGLFLVDRDGTNLMPLELHPDVGPGGLVDDSSFYGPSLSADGSHLTYFSRAGASALAQGNGLQVHVATLAPDGHVLDDRTLPHEAGVADFAPRFLPDGGHILFSRSQPDGTESVVLADVADLTTTRELWCCLAPNGARDLGSVIAPDGSSLLTWEWGKPDSPVTSLDLVTGTVTETGLTTEDNAAWQRVAMPSGS